MIVVTRTQPGASRTAKKLEAFGHKILLAPMLEVVLLDFDLCGHCLPDGFIVTSGHALQAVADKLKPAHKQIPLYCVGDRTAALARDMGFQMVHSASGNAEMLAKYILEKRNDGSCVKSLIYFMAQEGNQAWLQKLQGAGIKINCHAVYKTLNARQLPPELVRALKADEISAILLHSAKASTVFTELLHKNGLEDQINRLKFYAISAKALGTIKNIPAANYVIAEKPDESSLLSFLKI